VRDQAGHDDGDEQQQQQQQVAWSERVNVASPGRQSFHFTFAAVASSHVSSHARQPYLLSLHTLQSLSVMKLQV